MQSFPTRRAKIDDNWVSNRSSHVKSLEPSKHQQHQQLADERRFFASSSALATHWRWSNFATRIRTRWLATVMKLLAWSSMISTAFRDETYWSRGRSDRSCDTWDAQSQWKRCQSWSCRRRLLRFSQPNCDVKILIKDQLCYFNLIQVSCTNNFHELQANFIV